MAQPEKLHYRNTQNADIYFSEQLFATDWTGASDADKEKALIMATRSVDQMRYKGVKNSLYDALIADGGDPELEPEVILAKTELTPLEVEAAKAGQVKEFPRDGESDAEVWELTVTATNGNYTLTFNEKTTANIAYDATASTIQTALEALSNVSSGELVVTVSSGGTDGVGPYTITASGDLADSKNDDLTATSVDLTGSDANAKVKVVNDNIPDEIFWAVAEEARELLTGRDPQQEYRNLSLNSDGIGSNRVGYHRSGPGPDHTIHQIVSPKAWQFLIPYLARSTGSFTFRQV